MKHKVQIIEAARGAAALYVMVGHLFWTVFEVNGQGGPLFRIFRYGHEAVILFFFISGFSIHYTYCDRSLAERSQIKDYYFARIRRIYPIFLLAYVLTLALGFIAISFLPNTFFGRYSTGFPSMVAQFVFLTDLNTPGTWFLVPAGNPALWSLSYEVLYYLFYPLFWRLCQHKPLSLVLAFSVCFSLANETIISAGFPNHLSKVFGYYWMWCFGAFAGQLFYEGRRPKVNAPLYFVLMAITLTGVAVFDNMPLRRLNDWLWASLWALVFIGYMGRYIPASRPLLVLLVGSSAGLAMGGIAVLSYSGVPVPPLTHGLLFKVALAAALCAYLIPNLPGSLRMVGRVLRTFKSTGPFSYGLYALHLPILFFAIDILLWRNIDPIWAGLSLPFIVWLAKVSEERLTQFSRLWWRNPPAQS